MRRKRTRKSTQICPYLVCSPPRRKSGHNALYVIRVEIVCLYKNMLKKKRISEVSSKRSIIVLTPRLYSIRNRRYVMISKRQNRKIAFEFFVSKLIISRATESGRQPFQILNFRPPNRNSYQCRLNFQSDTLHFDHRQSHKSKPHDDQVSVSVQLGLLSPRDVRSTYSDQS